MQQLSIRRGDTFYAACQLVDQFGEGQPITGVTIAASLLDRGGNTAHEFSITVLNDNQGTYGLNELDTSSIPPALYTLQISYQVEGVTVSSTVFELNVAKRLVDDQVRFAQVGSVIGNTRVLITLPATPSEVSLWDVDWDVSWA